MNCNCGKRAFGYESVGKTTNVMIHQCNKTRLVWDKIYNERVVFVEAPTKDQPCDFFVVEPIIKKKVPYELPPGAIKPVVNPRVELHPVLGMDGIYARWKFRAVGHVFAEARILARKMNWPELHIESAEDDMRRNYNLAKEYILKNNITKD